MALTGTQVKPSAGDPLKVRSRERIVSQLREALGLSADGGGRSTTHLEKNSLRASVILYVYSEYRTSNMT